MVVGRTILREMTSSGNLLKSVDAAVFFFQTPQIVNNDGNILILSNPSSGRSIIICHGPSIGRYFGPLSSMIFLLGYIMVNGWANGGG